MAVKAGAVIMGTNAMEMRMEMKTEWNALSEEAYRWKAGQVIDAGCVIKPLGNDLGNLMQADGMDYQLFVTDREDGMAGSILQVSCCGEVDYYSFTDPLKAWCDAPTTWERLVGCGIKAYLDWGRSQSNRGTECGAGVAEVVVADQESE